MGPEYSENFVTFCFVANIILIFVELKFLKFSNQDVKYFF